MPVADPQVDARERVVFGNVRVDRVDLPGAVRRMRTFLASPQTHQVATVNLDFVALAGRRPDFRSALDQADLAVADGMPLVWLSKLGGSPLPERVAGVELVDEACRLVAERRGGVFLLGAEAPSAQAAAREIRRRHPGIRIVGVHSPPFRALSAAEDAEIVGLIQSAAPDLLLVAFGAPRQDLWIHAHRAELAVPIAIGVGCVLDLLAGELARAPRWMRRTGLEWAFRLAQEPRRLWRRYLLQDLPTLARLAITRRVDSRETVA